MPATVLAAAATAAAADAGIRARRAVRAKLLRRLVPAVNHRGMLEGKGSGSWNIIKHAMKGYSEALDNDGGFHARQ